ncbi:hypothetical protein C8R47DRAFT_1223206 [Mycena vitilis]|nr:hypothetical protein C8R47DRAFT_1223206 [Mycena vitilis]
MRRLLLCFIALFSPPRPSLLPFRDTALPALLSCTFPAIANPIVAKLRGVLKIPWNMCALANLTPRCTRGVKGHIGSVVHAPTASLTHPGAARRPFPPSLSLLRRVSAVPRPQIRPAFVV